MKFLIIGDLHGQVPNFYYEDYDAIIAPGDFCSSELREYEFEAIRKRDENPDSEEMWYDICGKEKARELIQESLEDGRKILEELDSKGVPVYVVPGNWDWTAKKDAEWDYLQKDHYNETLLPGLENVMDLHNWIADTDGHQIIGKGISSGPEYPQESEELEGLSVEELETIKEEYEEDYEKVGGLFEQATKPVIFLTHNVPYDTPLDVVGMEDSPRYGEHYGSVLAKELIEEYQPLVCIGAHIHEHFGKCEIGRTTVINAGFGPDKNTLLELDRDEIVKLEFHQPK